MASEMTTMTQDQILQQAGTAMLAQANQAPQIVLSSSVADPQNSLRAG